MSIFAESIEIKNHTFFAKPLNEKYNEKLVYNNPNNKYFFLVFL